MIEIKNVTKKYNGIPAIDRISFNVDNGTIFAFIGHNGAGKTTTIKSIVGINDFDSGEILINGISIKDNPVQAKKIMAYVAILIILAIISNISYSWSILWRYLLLAILVVLFINFVIKKSIFNQRKGE